MNYTTDLMTSVTIEQIVSAYESACEKIRAAHRELSEAQMQFVTVLGDKATGSSFAPVSRYANWYHAEPERYSEDILKQIRSGVWRVIIDLSGVKKILTDKRVGELEHKLDYYEMPEVTAANIIDILGVFVDGSRQLQEEVLKEAYDALTPRGYSAKYKTNQNYGVGIKVILTGAVDPTYSGFSVSSYGWRQQTLCVIDRAFHLLDGAGVPQGYNSPLIDAINTSGEAGEGKTAYFRFKCFLNRNLHLTMLRPDLVQKLNAHFGAATLAGPAKRKGNK